MKKVKYAVLAAIAALILVPAVSSVYAKGEQSTKTITLTKDNVIVLNDEVNGDSTSAVLTKAKELNNKRRFFVQSKEPIYMFMYTPGGSVQSGLEMMEGLKGSTRPVNTVTSFAASMGFQLVQGLGERYILSSGVLMSHHAAGGAEGQFGGKGTSQLQSRIGLWERRLKEMDEQTVKRTNGKQTLASYQDAYDHELWATGTESVDQGYADKVVVITCDSTLDGTYTKNFEIFGITLEVDFSNCPLNTSPVAIRVKVPTETGLIPLPDFQSKNGGFGLTCFKAASVDPKQLCASNIDLSYEKIDQIKKSYLDRFINIKDHIVPLNNN